MGEADVKPVTVKSETGGQVLKQKAVTFDSSSNIKKENTKTSQNDSTKRKSRKKKSKSGTKKDATNEQKSNTKKVEFKGGESKMNGHVFQLHDESNTPGQFVRTKQEVKRFVQSKYTYGYDIVYMLEMKEECDINKDMPEDPEDKMEGIVDGNGDPVMGKHGKQKMRKIKPSAGVMELWKEEIKAFALRRRTYKSNKTSLWALILGQCSMRLRAHLESLIAYKKKYAVSDCLWLLSEIHKAMSRFENTRYPPMSLADVYAKFFRFFQGNGLTDSEYMLKYQEFIDLFTHFQCDIGKDRALVKFELVQSKKTETEIDSIMRDSSCMEYEVHAKKAQERFFATCFLRGSNKTNYGPLVIGLENDYAQGANKFPLTVAAASNIKQTFKQQYGKQPTKEKDRERTHVVDDDSDSEKENEPVLACTHVSIPLSSMTPLDSQEESEPKVSLTMIQEMEEDLSDVLSTPMSLFDHSFVTATTADVPVESKPMATPLPHIALVNDTFNHAASDPEVVEVTLNNTEYHGVPSNWILLDNESSVSIFKTQAFLHNIHKVDDCLRVYGTGGCIVVNHKGTLPGFGLVWYSSKSIANILSFAEVEDMCTVRYTQAEHAFYVTNTTGKSLVFNRKPPGKLYYLDASSFLRAIKDSSKTDVALSQVSRAAHVPLQLSSTDRDIVERVEPSFRALGCPNPQSMLYLVRHNKISNLPFTVGDLERYFELMKGSHPDALVGHMTRLKPQKVKPWLIPVPQAILDKYRDVVLFGDLFFVPKLKFLSTISDHLEYITGHSIANRKLKTIYPHLEAIVHLYRLRGFRVVWLITDMEFRSLGDQLLQLDVHLNITSENEHVGKIERAIRTIKEDVRTILASLPYDKYPVVVLREVVLYAIYVRNLITRRNSPGGMSPAALIQGIKQTHENSSRLPFGTLCYIKSNETPHNSVENVRAVPAISLRPLGNIQGGYTFLQVHNWKPVARYTWRESVYTEDIIELIKQKVKDDKDILSKNDLEDLQNFVIRRADKTIVTSWSEDDSSLLEQNIFGQSLDTTQALPVRTPPSTDDMHIDSDDEGSQAEPPELMEDDDSDDETDDEEEQQNNDGEESDTDDEEDDDDPDMPHLINRRDINDDEDSDDEDDDTPQTHESHDDDEPEIIYMNKDTHHETRVPTVSEAGATDTGESQSDATLNAEAGADDNGAEAGAEDNGIEVGANLYDEFRYGSQRDVQAKLQVPAEINEENILPQNAQRERPGTERYSLRKSVEPRWKKPRLTMVNVDESNLNSMDYTDPAPCMRDSSNLWEIACTQMTAQAGVKRYGERAEQALVAEWIQLDHLNVYTGEHWYDMTREQRRNALRLVQLVKEKRCGKIKGRTCVDGRPQRAYINKEDSTSPTAHLESLLLSFMIDAADEREVAVVDIPGAFLTSDAVEETYVIVDGVMVDMLIKSNPEYEQFVHITKNGKKIVYLKLLKQMYGTVKAARVFYEGLVELLTSIGFESNPYDPCVMNKMVDGNQCTVIWHVDDLKISHKKRCVIDFVMRALQKKYNGSELKPNIGSHQSYVGMEVEFPGDKTVKITMRSYIDSAIADFPEELGASVNSPCSEHLFEVDPQADPVDDEKRSIFHTIVCRLLYISTRARPDIYLTIAFLTSRCSCTDIHDWKKLRRLLTYLRDTAELALILSADSMNVVKWWVDAAYGVRSDYRSQTGASMSLGRGCFQVKSVKQNLNTKSSTEAEVVAASDMAPHLLWTKYFLEAQGMELDQCVLYQDNESAMLLERNGRLSSGKRTKHINIRYFWLKDRISNGEITIEHCGTDRMIADFYTKPLQGKKFIMFRDLIMGHIPIPDNTISNQERVENGD